ncbi:hypothetical protein ACFWUU_16880 [Kribbella sp. NPDC058693]
MSEWWYGVRTVVARETTVRRRPDEPTSPESEVEVPPNEQPAAEE